MDNYNNKDNGPVKFPAFAELIETYCDRNPKERTKFICPVCEAGNLSVNMKSGKWDCMSEQSANHRQEICTWLNNKYRAEHPDLLPRKSKPLTERQQHQQQQKQADVEAAIATSSLDLKIEELISQYDPSTKKGTAAALTAELAAWAKAQKGDVYVAKMLFKERLDHAIKCDKKPGNTENAQEAAQALNTSSLGLPSVPVLSVATSREKDQFSLLQEMRGTTFDPMLLLPKTLATDVIRDASLLAIDPVSIWVYLLPTVASLMGKIHIDFSGWKVPNIIWSAISQKSGRGKTRAMSLVTAPLWDMERQAEEDFRAEEKQYKEDLRAANKDSGEEPVKPVRRKHLFNIATPQAVVKRLGEQKGGVLWCRDELKGAFALNQFTNGDGEGLEILLETFDGKDAQVDRVSSEDSFYVPESRLSIGGGFQPKIAVKMFHPEDPQGVSARFLTATAQDVPYKRIKGHPVLGTKLAPLYEWVASIEWGDLIPTVEADDLFTEIAEYFNNAPTPNDAIDFWMKKAAGQCLRVAGVLHVLECYYDPNKDKRLINRDTLMRAYYYVSLCRRWASIIQGEMVETTAISSLMQKIIDRMEREGSVTMPDLYRNIHAIRTLAKQEKRGIAEVTEGLCRDLQEMGLGEVFTNEKGNTEFRKPSTLNTENLETITPPTIESCVDDSEYQHSPTTVTHSSSNGNGSRSNGQASSNGHQSNGQAHSTNGHKTNGHHPPSPEAEVVAEPGDIVEIVEGDRAGVSALVDEVIDRNGQTHYLTNLDGSEVIILASHCRPLAKQTNFWDWSPS